MTANERVNIWSNDRVTWIDITDPTQEELREHARQYNLDYYALADCLEPAHLPKKESFSDFTFMILRVYDDASKNPSSIQEMSHKIAIFFNEHMVITVHRYHATIIGEIREKYLVSGVIGEASEIVTKLMYYVVLSFQPGTELLSVKIDRMEKQVFVGRPTRVSLEQLYYLRNSCRLNRRILTLSKEIIAQHVTTPRDSGALQDVKDLLQKLTLSLDETHDDSANLSAVYLSMVSMRTNDVMKLLTVFSVFFMPLTFIAGIYGMNFEFMPELGWRFGYPLVIGIMALISAVIFVWFKRRRIL